MSNPVKHHSEPVCSAWPPHRLFGPILVWPEDLNQSENKESCQSLFHIPTLQHSLPCFGYSDMVSEMSRTSPGTAHKCCEASGRHEFWAWQDQKSIRQRRVKIRDDKYLMTLATKKLLKCLNDSLLLLTITCTSPTSGWVKFTLNATEKKSERL